jgi:hypothetical protein
VTPLTFSLGLSAGSFCPFWPISDRWFGRFFHRSFHQQCTTIENTSFFHNQSRAYDCGIADA